MYWSDRTSYNVKSFAFAWWPFYKVICQGHQQRDMLSGKYTSTEWSSWGFKSAAASLSEQLSQDQNIFFWIIICSNSLSIQILLSMITEKVNRNACGGTSKVSFQ